MSKAQIFNVLFVAIYSKFKINFKKLTNLATNQLIDFLTD